ncbi:hypothetical protein FQN50_003953 [Emmonsiellopsis sp. PD_5]|nr:hypothetical protein FQN50_003953 [Emmonsiellopsis sp. PD_5]
MMDGYWAMDLDDQPYFMGDTIMATDMSQGNRVPFFRKQYFRLKKWADEVDGALPNKLLGIVYPADFDTGGNICKSREQWLRMDGRQDVVVLAYGATHSTILGRHLRENQIRFDQNPLTYIPHTPLLDRANYLDTSTSENGFRIGHHQR